MSKFAPSENQAEVLKVAEFVGLGKLFKEGFKWAKDYKSAPDPQIHADKDMSVLYKDNDGYEKTAYELRNTPGSATGGDNLPVIENSWFKGTHNSAGKLPKQIADKMRDMEFKNFDQFRTTFWKLVADEPKLSRNFEPEFLNGMKKGISPLAPLEQWNGKIDSYQLHHIKPIHDKGGVYDLDNIVIVTPRYHKEILDPSYHRGKANEKTK